MRAATTGHAARKVRFLTGVHTLGQALLPGGVEDMPDPQKVIFSVAPDYRGRGRRTLPFEICGQGAEE
jgi:hypothetical protein